MGLFEIEVVEGLETHCLDEIRVTLPKAKIAYQTKGAIGIKAKNRDWEALHHLKRAIAVYSVERFNIPRPKALLGQAHFDRLQAQWLDILRHHDTSLFEAIGLQAAGAESPTMQRLLVRMGEMFGLVVGEQGDLLVRVRKQNEAFYQGWEVLMRTTPRPLATRDWRVEDYHGALNGTVANIIVAMLDIPRDAPLLNVACGSGTLMIERYQQLVRQNGMSIGIDLQSESIAKARANQVAFEVHHGKVPLMWLHGDAQDLPFDASTWDYVVADLPFGQAIGSHSENEMLYPALLREVGRVAKEGARWAIITHELTLMERVLKQQDLWLCEQATQINLRGLHPKVYLLKRQ
jgi:tRNA (guanine6-N2)-methyltransferase